MKRAAAWAAILAAGLTLAGCSFETGREARLQSTGEPGSKYRFSLKDINGNTVSLDGLLANHKAVLINFWATWCPFCVEEIPELVKLQNKFAGRSFTTVGINAGESREDAAAYLKEHPVNYPILLDRDMAVGETYGIVGIPTSLLIRSDGRVMGVYHAVTAQLEAEIEQLLA